MVDALSAQGFDVTQATVSRDISELGLVKAPGADGHVYVAPEAVAASAATAAAASDERLDGSSATSRSRSGAAG